MYTYDQNGQLIAELDDQGNTLREYIYVDGQPLAYVTNNQVHFVHTDHLGTPQVITDASQQVVWAADYEPFGQTTLTTQTVTYNQRFPGQYFDQETGLHYNYFRDYDPMIGRYIESDPIGLEGGVNTYAYVLNNPIRFTDILGLDVSFCFSPSAASTAGHIGFSTPESNTSFGFYPTGNPFFSAGELRPDEQEDLVCKTADTDNETDECMENCRLRRLRNPGDYNLSTRQCTEYVRSCSIECGLIDENSSQGPLPLPLFESLPGEF